jgi:small subunit ribosomal protein S8
MIQDLISDMLMRLNNASIAQHNSVKVFYSTIILKILNILKSEGFIKSYNVEKELKITKFIRVFLQYKGWWIKKRFFSKIRRISKPSKRIFSSYKKFNKIVKEIQYNQGIAIISTSSGIISHLKAQKLKKGGEILCFIG